MARQTVKTHFPKTQVQMCSRGLDSTGAQRGKRLRHGCRGCRCTYGIGPPFLQERDHEDYVGLRGLNRLGKKEWLRNVEYGVARLIAALHPDDVVIGGGNAKKLKRMPRGCRVGENANAFIGGFRLREKPASINPPSRTRGVTPGAGDRGGAIGRIGGRSSKKLRR